jgi:hypothetical protein
VINTWSGSRRDSTPSFDDRPIAGTHITRLSLIAGAVRERAVASRFYDDAK